MKQKHLTYDERLDIEKSLKEKLSFKEIGRKLDKDCTTISKEIRNHIIYKDTGAIGRPFFDCIHGTNCEYREKGKLCDCSNCEFYEKQICSKLSKPPYVCNGCEEKYKCTLSKQFYDATYALKEYKDNLKETRLGITYNETEIDNLNSVLVPLIKEQGQSIHHAYINNMDKIMCSEKEIYNLIDMGALVVKNIDLPRKVRYRNKPKRTTYYKIDKKCLDGRKHEDFLNYMNDFPDTNYVEIDTVEGIKGGKVILTLHFVNCSFMLAFIREHNDSQSVIDIFNMLEEILRLEKFKELFPVILTDNGSEFTNPTKIEYSHITGEIRTKLFYCEPGRSDQKGSCEVNHEMIRRILPKGSSFNNLTQEDINLMMSHINSYKRKKLNNLSAIELFSIMYDKEIIIQLGITEINPNDIKLTKELFSK